MIRKMFGRKELQSLPESFPVSELMRYADKCLKIKTVYLWGGIGEFVTFEQLRRFAENYPEKRDKLEHLCKYAGKGVRGFDCSGLIKRFVMGGLDNYRYVRERDLNTKALLERSPRKGTMDSLPEFPGICLYMDGHTGIYAGNGKVIESTPNQSFGDGVVITTLPDRPWEMWYEMPWVDYTV